MEDFFEAHQFRFEPNVVLAGAFGNSVRVDFRITSKARVSLVNVMASISESSAHTSSLEIFSRWHDLEKTGDWNKKSFVTIYNSQSLAVREEDISRLKEYSELVAYPDEEDYLVTVLNGSSTQEVS